MNFKALKNNLVNGAADKKKGVEEHISINIPKIIDNS